LQPDQWESFFSSHHTGDIVTGKVCRSAAFGAFVEVAPGVEALCHSSEIVAPSKDKATLPVGTELRFKIIRMNPAEKKIGLSQKAAIVDEERQRMAEYQKNAAAASTATKEAASETAAPEPTTTENTNDEG